MRSAVRAGVGWCGAAFALAFAAGASAGVEITGQQRQVNVSAEYLSFICFSGSPCTELEPTVYALEDESAVDLGPFSATAESLPVFGGFVATQTSTLSATSIQAQGHGEQVGLGEFYYPNGPESWPGRHVTRGGAASEFEASFDVDSATPYRLTGSVLAELALAGLCCPRAATASAQVRLRTAAGETIAEVAAALDPDCIECLADGPESLDLEGVLAPGSYVLEASASGYAYPFVYGYFSNYVDASSTSQYEVELTLLPPAVPALGAGAQTLLAFALALLGLVRPSARRVRTATLPTSQRTDEDAGRLHALGDLEQRRR